jgi:putative chitinase
MSLKKLQEKIGVTPDGAFGPNTLKAAANYFKMTPEKAAHFFAQTSHETGGFAILTENMNYNKDGLMKIFPSYFPGNMADLYIGHPEKIGARVYANRMGNGDEKSGEGYKFRGRGALQTTGKTNYKLLSEHLHKPEIMDTPDLVATDYSFESAMFFFDNNKLWDLCTVVNEDAILKVSRAINLGNPNSKETPIGLDDRIAKTNQYYGWLKA